MYHLKLLEYDRYINMLGRLGSEPSIGAPTGESANLPRVFFVDSVNGADTNSGLTPARAKATLASAITAVTTNRGDVIVISDEHAETVTAVITVDKAGLTIIGAGNGRSRPAFTNNYAGDTISVTAADVKIFNLYFPVSTTSVCTARINIAGADVEVADCEFICGAQDTDGSITIPDAGDRAYVHDCVFRITANGPGSGVRIESATADGIRLENLRSFGSSNANAWDESFIYSTVAHTECMVDGIYNDFGPTLTFTAAATGLLKDIWPGDVAAGGSQLNPGNCYVQGGPPEGYLTRRATADIHTAGAVNCFTVTGRVIMTRIILEVTTVIGAGADTLALRHTPTGGDASTIAAASASIANKAVGDTFGMANADATYSIALNVVGAAPVSANGVVLKAGILATVSTNDTTGSTKIDLWWKPIDVGSAVVII